MRIVIIGNGIAGITAARHIRKRSENEVIVISSESRYFFSRTALMYVYMGHLKFEHTQPYEPEFWVKNRIDLRLDKVLSVQPEKKELELEQGGTLQYDKLILATGSKPNIPAVSGTDLKGVQGLYSKQDLESMERDTNGVKEAIVIGGGLIGIEMAEMLITRGIRVHFLIREKNFWGSVLPPEDSRLIMDHLQKHHGLEMHYEEELDEILGDQSGRVRGVRTKKGTEIKGSFLGLTIGVSPNIEFLKPTGIEINRGILVNKQLETSLPDVYAIGDCAEMREPLSGRRALEQVWYTGRMMGECVAATVCGDSRPYHPGPWFNSAKFFDVEYQTYGLVPARLPEGQEKFVWRNPKEEILIHLVWETASSRFVGINNFGLRLRHEWFDHCLQHGKSIEEVLAELAAANFDPEYYRRYETEIQLAFSKATGKTIPASSKKWWQKLIQTA